MAAHRRRLQALGVPTAALDPIESYLDTLARWSPRVNLTGARSAAARVDVLVAPVLGAAPLVDGSLLDVGSGNGSPGLVLALLRPEVHVTLLEPRARRWAFLRDACRAAGRPDIQVARARHDAYAGPAAQTVTLRALRLPLVALEPLLAPGGRVLVFGSEPAPMPGWSVEAVCGSPGLHVCRHEAFHGKQWPQRPTGQ